MVPLVEAEPAPGLPSAPLATVFKEGDRIETRDGRRGTVTKALRSLVVFQADCGVSPENARPGQLAHADAHRNPEAPSPPVQS